jgi:hypothetical protein
LGCHPANPDLAALFEDRASPAVPGLCGRGSLELDQVPEGNLNAPAQLAPVAPAQGLDLLGDVLPIHLILDALAGAHAAQQFGLLARLQHEVGVVFAQDRPFD